MLRTEWKFEYPATVVADACAAKFGFHGQRRDYWADLFEKAFKDLEDNGVAVSRVPITHSSKATSYSARSLDFAAESYSNSRTDISVHVDQVKKDLVDRYRTKYFQHKGIAEDFESYLAALRANPDATVPLDVQDINHFGLAGWKAEDETAQDE